MKRHKHSLSHYKLLSCNQGQLIPCGLTEVLPGDSIQQATSALIRVSPLLAPVMHPVRVRIHHWFVPHRLIWDDWESFITGGSDGFDASVFPTVTLDDLTTGAVGSLSDYMGVPPKIANLEVSALPFRGYDLIFNEWYRDQDLQTELPISLASGPDTTTSLDLQNVAWEKDYFTSARPWSQKGPEVSIPLQGNADVRTDGQVGDAVTVKWSGSPTDSTLDSSGATANLSGNAGPAPLYADMSTVSAANINELRLAFALQRYEEARARYGSRYTEYLRYLGVRSSDARLQRPEFLGSGTQTIQFSEVLQTGPDDIAQGNTVGALKGHGIGASRSRRFRRFFEEHGYIHTFLSVLPKTMYAQSLQRTWNRRTKEDFWQMELQHIGQQEIENREVYAAHSNPTGTFGYQDRYDEYRRAESSIAGEFRQPDLDYWHMARIFASDPTLNADFVKANPTDRIYAVSTNDVLWCMVNHNIQARRMVAKTGTSYIF